MTPREKTDGKSWNIELIVIVFYGVGITRTDGGEGQQRAATLFCLSVKGGTMLNIMLAFLPVNQCTSTVIIKQHSNNIYKYSKPSFLHESLSKCASGD